MRYAEAVLFSHRHHAPTPGVSLALDRVITPKWIARHVRLQGVVQDERLTTGLGRGTADARARLKVVVAGRLEATVGDRAFDLGPGDFLFVPRIADSLTCGGDDETLELDWDDDASLGGSVVATPMAGRLGRRAIAATARVTECLGDARGETPPHAAAAFASALTDAADAFAAEGLPIDRAGAREACTTASERTSELESDQRLLTAIDRTLEALHDGPATVELETRLGWSRRTITRRTTELHARLGLSGKDGESWRAVRDFYRLLVGTILASNARMTTGALSESLGYASPDALCHAFANAGLPSPSALRRV